MIVIGSAPLHSPRRPRFRDRIATSLGLALALAVGVAGFARNTPAASDPGGATTPAPNATAAADLPKVLVIVGAPGEADFGTNFLRQAQAWEHACERARAERITLGTSPADPAVSETADASGTNALTGDLAELAKILAAEPVDSPRPLWIVLIGHGTYDGQEAKFNLRGPDLSATQLAQWLKPSHRPIAVINTASASAPFIPKLAGTNRVVITATRSGNEQNYTRFGDYFAQTLTDPASDLDQDGQTSLLEAFLSTAAKVADFYKTAGRLATEHPLIDDTGDGLGTPPDWFRGLRATKRAKDGAALDGLRAHQFHLVRSPEEAKLDAATRAKRDELERQISELRDRQSKLGEDEYYAQLEALLLQLAALYENAGSAGTK